MDHLIGVYKILRAWKQPIYICHAGSSIYAIHIVSLNAPVFIDIGMFHSVYGTYDYRTSNYFDLRLGRKPLQQLIGMAAEELSFSICTSDRLGALKLILISRK